MADSTSRGPCVLIVDDAVQNIQVIGTLLRESGRRIHIAQSGMRALDLVPKINPDLILLDIMMPELDGFETCRRLKADAATHDIPVIFLTAKAAVEDIVKGFELGAVDYITKPFSSAEVLTRVDTHLEMQSLRKRLAQHNEELEAKVAERTAECRANQVALQQKVVELEGRDRLSLAQSSVGSHAAAYQEVLQVVAEVTGGEWATIHRPLDGDGPLKIVAAIGLAGPGVLQQTDDLADEVVAAVGPGSVVEEAFSDSRPRDDGNALAAPLLLGEVAIGAISVGMAGGEASERHSRLDALWRLMSCAALVINAVDMDARLGNGDLSVSDLLDLDE